MDSLTDFLQLRGRILFMCEDPDLLRLQLQGADLLQPPADLCNNVSTDEITPGWVCFWYDATLGSYAWVGLRNQAVGRDALRNAGVQVLVSGQSKGCGSSREQAPYAEKAAGVRLIIARSIEKIYAQNCRNIGLYTSSDFGLIERLRRGEAIGLAELTQGLDPIAAAVVLHGGLFAYNLARLAGRSTAPLPQTPPRPMTLAEKILARHAVVDAARGVHGIAAVQPNDALFCATDVRFSHEYVTPMAAALFKDGFGADARVVAPHSVFAFRDHLTFLDQVMPAKQRKLGLLDRAQDLATCQAEFCQAQGIRLYGEHAAGGSEAICHNAVLEDIALPGQLVIGTDSHTCTAGALGCLAFGVGATDMANAWRTQDVQMRVPASVRIELVGSLLPGVAAKDVMLHLMTDGYFRSGQALGQVLEFCGAGLQAWSVDERATLTNMAVEAGATTGIIAADAQVLAYLADMRGLSVSALRHCLVESDRDAQYAHRMCIDLTQVQPMVATPGDPRNGVAIHTLEQRVPVHVAYGGSCTGGKMADMDMYAEVLGAAVRRNQRLAPGVQMFIQFGSQKIKAHAQARGYIEIFEQVGAQLIQPSCGACINAGPGVSMSADEITISAINRNFPGRSGPGQVYLASPRVVAASALAGFIAAF